MAKKKKSAAKVAKKKKLVKGISSIAGMPKKATRKRVAKKSVGTCFVMMPFKDPFNVYYQSIFKPAIMVADLEPVRTDDMFRPSVIVADLWQIIQDCKVLLAELTTKNANVFYELGLAHAIGKPVILVSETMDDVPFDLQQLRVLLYDKDDPVWGEKLTKGITNALKETLASAIEAVPGIFRKKVESQAPKQDATSARIEALERQMRAFRAQAPSPRSLETDPEINLERVTTWSELEEWARRWHAVGFEADVLESIIKRHRILGSGDTRDTVIKRMREAIS